MIVYRQFKQLMRMSQGASGARLGFLLAVAVAACAMIGVSAAARQVGPKPTPGAIQGIVTRSDGERLPNVKVVVTDGPIDPAALRTLNAALNGGNLAIKSPANGLADAAFFQSITDAAAARGVAIDGFGPRDALNAFRAANEALFMATTNGEGVFTISNLPPGQYKLRAQRDGFYTVGVGGAGMVTDSVVVGAARTTDVAFSMLQGGRVGGRVMNLRGLPEYNVTIQALKVTYQNGFAILQAGVTKTSDDRGEYRLFWLPPGEYLIAAIPTETAASVAPNQQSFLRTFYPGTADLASATPVIVGAGGDIPSIDITLQNPTTYKAKGIINDRFRKTAAGTTQATLAATQLYLMARDPSTPDMVVAGKPTIEVPMKWVDGSPVAKFELPGLLPGAYDLFASVREPNPDGGLPFAFGHVAFDIGAADLDNLSVDIYHSVRVQGVVTVDDHTPGSTAARVSLQVDGTAAKRPIYQGIASRAMVANADTGVFTVTAVLPGHYRVQMGAGLPPELYLSDVLQGGASVFDTGFEVGSTSPGSIQVLLKSGAGTVDGTVEDATGKPVGGATVVLIPPETRRANRALYKTVIADAAGKFIIRGITPGNYKLFAWENVSEGAYFNDRFLGSYEDRGYPLSVSQAATVTGRAIAIPATGR